VAVWCAESWLHVVTMAGVRWKVSRDHEGGPIHLSAREVGVLVMDKRKAGGVDVVQYNFQPVRAYLSPRALCLWSISLFKTRFRRTR
jgi:hypothetical protein